MSLHVRREFLRTISPLCVHDLKSVNDFIGNLGMARKRIGLHRLQRCFLVVAVLENPVVETRRKKFQSDFLSALVFPEPAMNPCAGRDECAVELIFTDFVVEFVGLVVVVPSLPAGFTFGSPWNSKRSGSLAVHE